VGRISSTASGASSRRRRFLAHAGPPDLATIGNNSVFLNEEFSRWAFGEGLEPGEKFLIEKYLDHNAATLEAGTGGGRILQCMQTMGFKNLHGFDVLPEMISWARLREGAESIGFRVQDATTLDYPDASFDQLLYLQQVLCFIPTEEGRLTAMQHAHRILRSGGVAVFSFLSSRVRSESWPGWSLIWYLRTLRALRGSGRSAQYLPWLKLNGSWNPGALLDCPPYVYWYREREVCEQLTAAGFQLVAVGSDMQAAGGRLLASVDDLERSPLFGALYIVCRCDD
jgi:SAM-dependent methyltransferase